MNSGITGRFDVCRHAELLSAWQEVGSSSSLHFKLCLSHPNVTRLPCSSSNIHALCLLTHLHSEAAKIPFSVHLCSCGAVKMSRPHNPCPTEFAQLPEQMTSLSFTKKAHHVSKFSRCLSSWRMSWSSLGITWFNEMFQSSSTDPYNSFSPFSISKMIPAFH